jgi:hypothetical protein
MQSFPSPRHAVDLGPVVGGALAGTAFIATGLALAYLTVDTPMISRLAPSGSGSSAGIALAIWSFALIAGGAFIVAGTDHLATTLAAVRGRRPSRSPVLRALAGLPDDVVVATGVVPQDGRAVPELVIGPFGVAIVHELPPTDVVRQVAGSWELRTDEGWAPTEAPLDRASRDADRVRRWLAHGDLDFVVRVYAAVVAPTVGLPRTATCAVITQEQIPGWLAALPRQRSLNARRQDRLQSLIKAAIPGAGALTPGAVPSRPLGD